MTETERTPGLPPSPDPDQRLRELRLHGVGASPGATVLGLGSPDAAIVVAEGVGGTSFLARRDDETIEGYKYDDLTSFAGVSALSVFLLPFTALNAAGWAHPHQRGLGKATRFVVHWLSVAMTAMYLFGLAMLLVDLVGYQWTRRLACGGRRDYCGQGVVTLQWLGVAVALALLGAAAYGLVWLASSSQSRYEQIPPPAPLRRRLHPLAPWGAEEDLTSPSFFWHPGSAKRLLRWHEGVLAASWLLVLALTLTKMLSANPPLPLDLNAPFVGAGFMASFGVAALWVFALITRADGRSFAARAGPAIAATVAFGLVLAFASGLFLLATQRLQGWTGAVATAPALTLGYAVALVDVWGCAFGGIAVLGGVYALAFLRSTRKDTTDIPPRTAGPGLALDGVDAGMRGRVASARSLAYYAHRAEWPGLVVALGLFLTNAVFYSARAHWYVYRGHLQLVPVVARHDGPLFTIGAYGLTFLPLFVARAVQTGGSNIAFIGTLWDVLTLFPRRFSPLAVRCYAERAVPELQGRIDHHVQHGRPVLVSAHSQGSVLVLAALASLPEEYQSRVVLVTYGCPIATLYGHFFPGYLNADLVARVRHQLLPLEEVDAELLRWRNFYRRTDPIGGPVFVGVPGGPPPWAPLSDTELPDPMPVEPGLAVSRPGETPLEHDRTPWTEILGHSHYLTEPAIKDWVARVKAALGGPPAPPS